MTNRTQGVIEQAQAGVAALDEQANRLAELLARRTAELAAAEQTREAVRPDTDPAELVAVLGMREALKLILLAIQREMDNLGEQQSWARQYLHGLRSRERDARDLIRSLEAEPDFKRRPGMQRTVREERAELARLTGSSQ